MPLILQLLVVTLFFVFESSRHAHADEVVWRWQESSLPDVGFDLDEATVYRVTTLANEGAGSLRQALLQQGPRLVVFEVGGVIDLKERSVRIADPQIVVAGQTAPSPGITLIKGGLQIKSSQVVVQHLRIRPGDAGKAKRSGWEPDGITTTRGPSDVWIDHCSVTWCVDEGISPTSYKPENGIPSKRLFVRNCIIAEGLSDSTHEKGPHSKGSLIFGGTQQVALVGNLYCSNFERNPLFQPETSGVVVNNLISNPGQRSIHAGSGDQMPTLSVVGNIVLFGTNTKLTSAVFEGTAEAYFDGNVGFNRQGQPIPVLRRPFETLEAPPLWPEGLETMGETETLWHVARSVGARPGDRDATDTRIVREALTGTSRIIDSQDEVEGYPEVEPVQRPLEVPDTDRRSWLLQHSRNVGVQGSGESNQSG
ncbi:MAG: right-handed parallel beta-helix repeat-containing protein [Verrucomicrobiota bacterium]